MDVEKLSISLPVDLAKMIRSQVAAGAYASNSDVIQDALRLWQQRQNEQRVGLEAIRAKIDDADVDADDLSADQVRTHFERRLAHAGIKPTA